MSKAYDPNKKFDAAVDLFNGEEYEIARDFFISARTLGYHNEAPINWYLEQINIKLGVSTKKNFIELSKYIDQVVTGLEKLTLPLLFVIWILNDNEKISGDIDPYAGLVGYIYIAWIPQIRQFLRRRRPWLEHIVRVVFLIIILIFTTALVLWATHK